MKGTAILYREDQSVTIIEDVEQSVFEDIKKQCGCENCNTKIENQIINYGTVSPALWHEDEVDWDYGY
ncbi:hypothetical protein [Cytobacillus gottheilii]|uniref:hypothetical protein n=1 Tax=Cytobacillus gottheilii TaxID=859144 RepID=UPI0009BB6695|nr:hypothetical protein [Cytobacillus gottheilii]